MTTPRQRISRLLDEGAKFIVELPGHAAIDLTPDVIAAMDEISNKFDLLDKRRNLLKTND
jgi:hypothetical protein